MRELIEQVPHFKPTEDFDKTHLPETCLRCRMEVEWTRVLDMLDKGLADVLEVLRG